jgi:ketopantoate reductase
MSADRSQKCRIGKAMSDPRILVLGAGGIGGYFGGRLAEAGADVTFLVREGRRKLLDERGLRIESQFGNVELDVRTVLASDVGPDYNAVILTCKAYFAGEGQRPARYLMPGWLVAFINSQPAAR